MFIFKLILFFIFSHRLYAGKSDSQLSESKLLLKSCQIQRSNHSHVNLQFQKVCKDEVLLTSETAIVLVDLWKKPDEANDLIYIKIRNLLESFRKNGSVLIFGIGEIALNQPKYKKFRKKIKAFLGEDYCRKKNHLGGKNLRKIYSYMSEYDVCEDKSNELNKTEASETIAPHDNENEFFVYTEDEFRYVLERKKIKNLIYIGGALDECIMQRSYGINVIKGTDELKTAFKVYIASDLVYTMPTVIEGISAEQKANILIESLTFKIAASTDSKSFNFTK